MRHGRSRLRLRLCLCLRPPAARSLARRSASPILACKLLTSPRISCGVVCPPADSLRPTSLGPFTNSIADYAQSGRCLQQQQATSVSVLVVLHVLRVGQQLRTVASSSRIHWRVSSCLDWALDSPTLVSSGFSLFRHFSRFPSGLGLIRPCHSVHCISTCPVPR